MNEEIIKQKYRYLNNDLNVIKKKLEDLIEKYEDVNEILKDTLLVDNKIIAEDLFTELLTNQNKILHNLKVEAINKIKEKL